MKLEKLKQEKRKYNSSLQQLSLKFASEENTDEFVSSYESEQVTEFVVPNQVFLPSTEREEKLQSALQEKKAELEKEKPALKDLLEKLNNQRCKYNKIKTGP